MPKESPIKIIPKPKAKITGWFNILYWFSIILLIVSVIGFFFVKKQISSLEERGEEVSRQIIEVAGQEERNLEKELFAVSQKIKDFSELLEKYKSTTRFFNFLKASCHPKIRFLTLNLSSESYTVNLEGETDSFQVLGEQFLVLNENENVKDLHLSNTSLDREGKVRFNLSFVLSEELFIK